MTTSRPDEAAQPPCRLRLLGTPALLMPGAGAWPLPPKAALLLALVALDGPLPRDRLIRLLWPGTDRSGALNNLRQRLHGLQRKAGAPLIRYRPQLALEPGVQVDGPSLGEGGAIAIDDPRLAQALLDTVTVDDAPEAMAWLRQARQHWATHRVQALLQQADLGEAAGRSADALAAAQRATDIDPLHDGAHARCMRLLYAQGQGGAALDLYARFESRRGRQPSGSSAETAARDMAALATRAACHRPSPPPLDEATLATLARPPRRVGRDADWARLQRAVGLQRPCVLIGEAGIGKTRLLTDFTQGRDGTLQAAGRPGDATQPFALAARLLGARAAAVNGLPAHQRTALALIDPTLAALPQTPQPPPAAALQAAFAAALQDVVLITVDDLHLADAASIALVAAVARVGEAPAWLLASRPVAAGSPLQQWLDAAATDIDVIRLQALDRAALAELLTSLQLPGVPADDWVDHLFAHAGGHPYYTLETLHEVVARDARPDALPQLTVGTRETIERRLTLIGDRATQLARVAALAGEDFGVDLAAAVLGCHPAELTDAWSALQLAQVLDGRRIRHDLMRDALLQTVPAPIAAWMHRAIARCLAAQGAAAGRQALHWQAAGQPAEAARQWQRAAADAQRAARRQEEAELLARAADAFDAAGLPDDAFACHADRVGALVQTDARHHRAAADELLAQAHTAIQQAQAQVVRAEALNHAGEFDEAARVLPTALAQARAAGDLALALIAVRRLAYAWVNLGRADDAVQALRDARPVADQLPDAGARAEFYSEFGNVLSLANHRAEAVPVQQRGIELSRQRGNHTDAMTGLCNLAVNHYQQGDLANARACLEQALASPAFEEQAAGIGLGAHVTLAQVLRDQGEFSAALAELAHARAGLPADGSSIWSVVSDHAQAQLWLALGQTARAWQMVEADVIGMPPFIEATRLLLRAQTLRRLGRASAPWVERAAAVLATGPRADVQLRIDAEHCLDLPPSAAADQARRVHERARTLELHGLAAVGLVRLATALQTLDPAAARDAATQAAAALRTATPMQSYLPEHWLALAQVRLAVGEGADAGRVRAEAERWIAQAAPRVPPSFRETFTSRHPVHVALRRLPWQPITSA